MARPKTQAERKRSFSTLKDPRMDSDGAFRNTKPLPAEFKPLVVRPHLLYGDKHPPLIDGEPIPAEDRYKYAAVQTAQRPIQTISRTARYQTAADILKRATKSQAAAIVGNFMIFGSGDKTRAWAYVSLIYCDGAKSAQQIADALPWYEVNTGSRAASYLSKMYRAGLLAIDGEAKNATGHTVRTYRLSDETATAVSSLVADIKRRQESDSDDGRPVSDTGRVREIDIDAVYRPPGKRVSATTGVSAEGDD